MEREILTISQAAKMLQVDPNTIYRWARSNKFPASKIGKEWRVLRKDVLKFVESKKVRSQLLSESQEAELITALIGRREIPAKFEYFEKGADRYASFAHPQEFGGESELEILLDHQRKILDSLGESGFNLLDLGCGDGKKASFFISHINKKVAAYFALDDSLRMIDIATNNIELAFPSLPHESFEEDFEQGNIAHVTYYLKRRYQTNTLILFLGNTIGNISDAHRILINLRESMTENDFLMVGLATHNSRKIPLTAYNSPGVIEWLWSMPEKLGIKRTDAKIYSTYNEGKKQIESYLEFTNSWSQTFGNNFIQFPKGQRIRLLISRRFTKEDIFKLFAGAGFKIELLLTDKEMNNALVLCRPHSWERKI